MSKHTPTPWSKRQHPLDKSVEQIMGHLPPTEPFVIATMSYWAENAELKKEQRDNAAFIVRAVNSHDALVAALEIALYDMGERMQRDPGWRPRSLTKLQAALKLAKG